MLNNSFSSGNILCPYNCAGARMTILLWIAAVLEWIYSLDCGRKDSFRLHPRRNRQMSTVEYTTDKLTGKGQRLRIWKDVHGRHSPWEDILLKKKGKEREYKRHVQTSSGYYMKRVERVFLNLVHKWMWEIGRVTPTQRGILLRLPCCPYHSLQTVGQ